MMTTEPRDSQARLMSANLMLRRSKVVDFRGKTPDIPLIRADRTRRSPNAPSPDQNNLRDLPACVEDGNQPFPLAFSGVRPVF